MARSCRASSLCYGKKPFRLVACVYGNLGSYMSWLYMLQVDWQPPRSAAFGKASFGKFYLYLLWTASFQGVGPLSRKENFVFLQVKRPTLHFLWSKTLKKIWKVTESSTNHYLHDQNLVDLKMSPNCTSPSSMCHQVRLGFSYCIFSLGCSKHFILHFWWQSCFHSV